MSDSRLGNIGSILKDEGAGRARLAAVNTAPPAPEPVAPPPVDSKEPRKNKQPAATRTRKSVPKRTDARAPVRVPVRLDPDLRDQLAQYARSHDLSFAIVAFEAIEAAHKANRLGAILAEEPPDRGFAKRIQGALFTRPDSRRNAAPKVTTELRMTATNRDLLDKLIADHGATDRTHLITAALRAYLIQH